MVAQLPLTKIKQLSQLDTKMAVRMNRNINNHIDISKQHERCLLSNMRQQRWPTIMHHTKNNADSPPPPRERGTPCPPFPVLPVGLPTPAWTPWHNFKFQNNFSLGPKP